MQRTIIILCLVGKARVQALSPSIRIHAAFCHLTYVHVVYNTCGSESVVRDEPCMLVRCIIHRYPRRNDMLRGRATFNVLIKISQECTCAYHSCFFSRICHQLEEICSVLRLNRRIRPSLRPSCPSSGRLLGLHGRLPADLQHPVVGADL